MDISLLIRQRLEHLGLEQKDLAAGADVTESYISQLLKRKKAPPAPARTDIYEKIGTILKLPPGELARLANLQRQQMLRRKVADPARPLFGEFREVLLRKCAPDRVFEIRQIFEKEPFGELERLITQTLLDVAQEVVVEGLESEEWQSRIAPVSGRSFEQMRVAALEFLDTDIFNVSEENCVSFLEPLLDGWDIDLRTFSIDVALNPDHSGVTWRRFAFTEVRDAEESEMEPGLEAFLADPLLCGDVTEEELGFLNSIRFRDRRPSPMYYYRELQSLRDPLHFDPVESGSLAAGPGFRDKKESH